jgi:superfamily II DNA/RNA helicase
MSLQTSNTEILENTGNETELPKYESFEDLELKDKLLRGIFAFGFEKPSIIQQTAIKPFLDGRDLIAQSQSGTGKTATFAISVLQSLKEEQRTQALVISHTRELSNQIHTVFSNLSRYMDIKVCLLAGGSSIRNNIDELSLNPQVIVGTPGRVLDMMSKNYIAYKDINYLVVDEADEMLSRGFVTQVQDIFKFLRSNQLQVGLYSATMPKEFFEITDKFMDKPLKILVKTEQLTLEGIKQFYVNAERNDFKFETLCDLYNMISAAQSIIYCNSKKIVNDLSRRLADNNFTVATIHGEMPQEERTEIVEKFRRGDSRILLSTDLLSRGIDVQQVSIVINYDIPYSIENYIHRIGRSGRFGRKGVAINFVTHVDIGKLHDIQKYYHTMIEELPENFSEFL